MKGRKSTRHDAPCIATDGEEGAGTGARKGVEKEGG